MTQYSHRKILETNNKTSRKILGTRTVWGKGQKQTERLSCIFIHKFKVNVQFQALIREL